MGNTISKLFKAILVAVLLLSFSGNVLAADINLTVRDGGNVFVGTVSLPTGITSLNDRDRFSHTIDANSVLSALISAGQASGSFSIADADLQFFPPFDPSFDPIGSFLVNCITITSSAARDCNNWQYAVGSSSPQVGMDKTILSGGENVYVYFGPQNRVLLSSGNITTNDTLTVTAQEYDYANDAWATRIGKTIGLTQPDPDHPFSPIEIKIKAVDGNGQAVFSSIPAGSYDVGIQEDFYFPTETLIVTTPPPAPSRGGSRKISAPPEPESKPAFDLGKAFEFLVTQQKENGSFGEDLYTDWATLALATGNYQEQILKLVKYFGKSKIANPRLTDYERRAMALMSLGLNPYNINGENYIEKITASFNGKQFGNINEDNDDIFALLVLQDAGYTEKEKMIADSINYILTKQKENGSWDESIDITGAAMQVITIFTGENFLLRGVSQVDEPRGSAPLASGDSDLGKERFSPVKIQDALLRAKEFLKQNQKEDGGFGNISSTAWAIGGILALSEKPEDWIKNKNTPLDYLAFNQDADGGIKNENLQNKIWETAYTLTALSGKTWNQIMQKFEKPKEYITIEEKEMLETKIEKILALLEEKKIVTSETLRSNVAKNITQNEEITKNQIKENKIQKLENLASKSTATVINSSENKNIEPIKKSWFVRFLEFIF